MISVPDVTRRVIRGHYDLTTVFYRLLWGPHIHHGLWDADEPPHVAQVRLMDALADRAEIRGGERVLDVGCGMGGSSLHLARTRGCDVTGVTVSGVQRAWAGTSAWMRGLRNRVRFRRADAESLELPDASFDVVWSIECTEHLFDKPRFFAQVARWLRPGGRVAICAWLAGAGADGDERRRRQVEDVCEGFFCPSLGSRDDYVGWMRDAGLRVDAADDWTTRVTRTWEICAERVRRSGVRRLARLVDRNTVLFLDRFGAILEAYRSGAMEYGCLVARKDE